MPCGNSLRSVAIRGNVDRGIWADEFSETEIVEVDDLHLYVLHDLGQLDLDPAAAGFRVVIYGHSHDPKVAEKQGVVYLNPGSAGPRRLRLPISMARMIVGDVEGKGDHAVGVLAHAVVCFWQRSPADWSGVDLPGAARLAAQRK